MSLVLFLLSPFLFIAGVPPFSSFGIHFVFGMFLFWGRKRSLIEHALGGTMVGIVLDTYSVLPFGTHVVSFMLLSLFTWLCKVFLKHRYIWGDISIIGGGLVVSEVLVPAVAWFFGYMTNAGWISGEAALWKIASIAVVTFFCWLLLRYEYSYRAPSRLLYQR
ncbi:MAG: hypothetical protein HY471_01665 [Candidatus Sungbacteria bacterium]|nr:hypothetical protein [Candidatus Sungbacteria bacterium]